MRNVLKITMGVKFHITSYRVWAGTQTRPDGDPKVQLSSKWTNLQRRLELIWRSFFACMTFFCAILSFWDMINFVFFLSGVSRNLKKNQKLRIAQKKVRNTISPIITLCIFWDKHHFWKNKLPKTLNNYYKWLYLKN